jgi:uncharacterized membrane protein YgcG
MQNKMQNKIKVEAVIIFSLFVFSFVISSAVFVLAQQTTTTSTATTSATTTSTTTTSKPKQGLLVNPGKLGIYRVTIPLFSDYVATKSFVIGNAYDTPINVSLSWSGNISTIAQLSETSFQLKPNETKTVHYTITVSKSGIYGEGVGIVASVQGRPSFIGYQADLYVFAMNSQVPETLYVVAGIVVVFIIAAILVKKIKFSKGGKKAKASKKAKIIFASLFALAIMGSLVHSVSAKNVAMIVKDINNLDPTHEQRIYDILEGMGLDITLVDKNVGVNYNNYDLIVVAGRPLGGGMLDSFVANLPVNSRPTIAIDFSNPDNWGWVKGLGTSSLTTSDRQKVFPQIAHPLTYGYSVGQKVYVHLITGYSVINMVQTQTNLTTVATAESAGHLPIIAYANPNTQLANGNKVANNAAIVFFGVTYPNLWTQDAINLFSNSVNWLLSLDFTAPTVPQLATPDAGFDKDGTVTWIWNASTHPSGISYYEFQLSNSPTFATVVTNATTTNLNYTTSGMIDTQTYYARVRAWNTLNVFSNWSSAKVTIDSTNVLIKINSPANNTAISYGDLVIVNATIATPNRMPASNGTCNVTIANTFAGTIQFNKTINTCSGTVTAPTLSFTGSATLDVSAMNTLGHINSTSIPIQYQGPAASSSSSSSGGGSSGSGGSSFGGALLIVQVPAQLSGNENSDMSFVVNVKNEGMLDAEAVKVVLADADFAKTEISPVMIDTLAAGASQDFSVTLHLPENSIGTYQFKVKILAYGASITRRVSLEVLPEVKEPNLTISGVELPASFVESQETTVNYTITNDGNAAGTAVANVVLPSGWNMRNEDANQTIVVQQGSNEKVLFHVTPSAESGKIGFSATYPVGSEEKSLAQSDDASVTPNSMSITGLVGFISRPEVFVPALVGLGAFAIVYFGAMGGLKGIKLPKTRITNSLHSPSLPSFSLHSLPSLKSAANFLNSLRPTQETLRYVWPRGSKGFIFNSLFGASAGLATGSATSSASRTGARIPRAQKGSRSAAARVLPKTLMYEKWENRYHSPRNLGKAHRKV